MLMLQPSEWLSENVLRFPVDATLRRFLAEYYTISVVELDSVNYGFPVARLRSYQLGVHKSKVAMSSLPKQLPVPLNEFVEKLRRPCKFSWMLLWWIHENDLDKQTSLWESSEIQVELDWAGSRPTVRPVTDLSPEDIQYGPWFTSLSGSEQDNAKIYALRYEGKACSLTQSAVERATCSTALYLQTFIHNFGILWNWKSTPCRWLTASECLSAMGFPVYPPYRDLVNVNMPSSSSSSSGPGGQRPFLLTSFDVSRPDRKPQTVRDQCGNSDALVLATVCEIHSLLLTKKLSKNVNFMYK